MKKINADPSEYDTQNDLSELEVSRQHLDNFLKYAINPKLSFFTTNEKLAVAELCERMQDLLIELRINHISPHDRTVEAMESVSKAQASETSIN